MPRVVILNPGQTLEILDWPDISLKRVQEAVGGYFQMLQGGSGIAVLVNEEGLIHGLPYNVDVGAPLWQPLVGPLVFVGLKQSRWVGLTGEQQERIRVTGYVEKQRRTLTIR